MFIGRRPDGSIWGTFTSAQPNDDDHPGMEEVADDHPDVIAFNSPKPRAELTVDQKLATVGLTVSDLKDALAK